MATNPGDDGKYNDWELFRDALCKEGGPG